MSWAKYIEFFLHLSHFEAVTDIEEFFLHLCHFEAVTDIEELSPKNKATSPRLSILCLEYIFFFLHLCSSLKKIILAPL